MVRGKTNNKAANGRRYTKDQREKIIRFVIQVNAEKGRGGVAAAAKRFGVSASSIGKWISEGGESQANGVSHPADNTTRRSAQTRRVLAQLIELRESIDALERELAMKSARFEALKRKV